MKSFDINSAIQRTVDKAPLFSSIILGLEPLLDKSTPTIATNGSQLIYNPDFMSKLSDEEASGVILHETLHCAFNHLWRKRHRDSFLFNMATDFAINSIVDEMFKCPKGSLLDPKYYGMSAEQIYEDLKKRVKRVKAQGWCEKNGWGDGKKKNQGKGQQVNEADKERWKGIFDQSILKQYGKMPDSIKRVIDKTYYVPVIDWASLVANILSEDNQDYTFSYPDRRFLDSDFLLPDMQSQDKLKDVVVMYDTSGSISEADLRSFYMETLSLLSNFSSFEGWIGMCDAEMHGFKKVTAQSSFEDFNFMGGGGTDFAPAFKEVQKRGLSPKALFYFTDLEGNFPTPAPSYPVFWLVKSYIGDTWERQVPFGQVIKFLGKV